MIENSDSVKSTNKDLKEVVRFSRQSSLSTKNVNDIIAEKIRLKFNGKYTKATIEDVINIQWKFLKSVMDMGKLHSVRFKYLGVFGVKNYKMAFYQRYVITDAQRKEYNKLLSPDGKDTIVSLDYLNDRFKDWQESQKQYLDFYEFPVIQYQLQGRSKIKNNVEVARFNRVADAIEATGYTEMCIYNSCVNKAKLSNGVTFKLPEKDIFNFITENEIEE